MWEDKSCPGCHFNHPEDPPRLKLHQDVGCPALAKHGYICGKDVTASSKVLDKFSKKYPKITDQSHTSNPVEKIVCNDLASDQFSARRVHSPSILNSALYSRVPTAPIENNLLLLPNQAAPTSASNGYADIYSSDSEDKPVFKKMVSNYKTVKSINIYSVVPPRLTLASDLVQPKTSTFSTRALI